VTPVLQTSAIDTTGAAPLLAEFRRAATHVPAYQVLLDEHGVRAEDVRDVETFSTVCPLLSKANTFDRFALPQLSIGGRLQDVGEVLTSSGHGGRFSFGVISRAEAEASASFVDAALDAAFGVKSRKTLAINCLPMGVVISSRCMTVATTSVREDMAVALVKTFGDAYEQILLIGDPLFMKRLTDHAVEQGLDWRRHRVNVVIGEETFGEHFRTYIERCLGLEPDRPDGGRIMSSFGVAELGLHLCFETAATAALVRATRANPALAREMLGRRSLGSPGSWQPMLLSFDSQRTFIEVVDPDDEGYGKIAISMLDPGRQVPLLRYQTGDVACLLDRARVTATLRDHGVGVDGLSAALLALRGRVREALPNGGQVGVYKDALYANPELARDCTGATRLIFTGERFTMHVQLVRGQRPHPALEQGLMQEIPDGIRPSRLRLWEYAQFPFGMTLDYERKFQHYVPGDMDPVG
jgi:phenylacetate-CoA ligase